MFLPNRREAAFMYGIRTSHCSVVLQRLGLVEGVQEHRHGRAGAVV